MNSSATDAPRPLPGAPAHRKSGLFAFFKPRKPKEPTWWNYFPSDGVLFLTLAALTLLGGYLRFFRLGFQSYWFDEGHTVERIAGTSEKMFNSLATGQGFPPGWYVLLREWQRFLVGIGTPVASSFTPESLRILPAILGTLAIPAMYFLARQFTDRKGALLVMLLAAVNPYLIYYSRDIKMYMALWFLVICNIGFFFRWLSSQEYTWIWWPLFLITGAGAMVLHAGAALMFVVQFFWLLLGRRLRALDGFLWAAAVAFMLAFPTWWYISQNQWINKATLGNHSGVEWNQDYTSMNWQTLASLPLSHLFGYLWPVTMPDAKLNAWLGLGSVFDQHLTTRTHPRVVATEVWLAVALGAIMLLGLFPWRGRRPSMIKPTSALHGRWWYVALWILLPTVLLMLTWLPKESRWYTLFWGWYYRATPKGLTPIWEPRYLGIVLPAFLLWLATSLRRLPTAPVRAAAIIFVVLVSLASAGTNYFIYRQTPWRPTGEAIEKFGKAHDQTLRTQVALGTPFTRFPAAVDQIEYELASHLPPDLESLDKLDFLPKQQWERTLDDNAIIGFLDRVQRIPQVKVIVLTDRNGDLTEGPISNARLNFRLGSGWKLVHEENYRWYYEWRYFLFNTWRTRVWTRQEGSARPPPASPPITLFNPPSTRPATRPPVAATASTSLNAASRPATLPTTQPRP